MTTVNGHFRTPKITDFYNLIYYLNTQVRSQNIVPLSTDTPMLSSDA